MASRPRVSPSASTTHQSRWISPCLGHVGLHAGAHPRRPGDRARAHRTPSKRKRPCITGLGACQGTAPPGRTGGAGPSAITQRPSAAASGAAGEDRWPEREPRAAPGPGDVRRHRPALRSAEPPAQRQPRPALAPAGRRASWPPAAAAGCWTSAAGPATCRVELARRPTPAERSSAAISPTRCSTRAGAKFRRRGVDGPLPRRWRRTACACPSRDGRFDAVTVAFGVRNFADLDAGFREIHRVLRPGGRMVVLEFSRPDRAGCSGRSTGSTCAGSCPALGDAVAGRSGPYGYLARTIAGFPRAGPRWPGGSARPGSRPAAGRR